MPKQKRPSPLVMAHRGGAGLWPENTMYAFARAAAMGVDVLEMDIHSTADGELVVIHDSTLDRTTDGSGRVTDARLADVKRLDAGYRWTGDHGSSFPFRGVGITVPTLREVFSGLPDMRLNIDIKQAEPSLVEEFCRLIRRSGMASNIIVGSFRAEVLDEFRRACPEVATAASPVEVRRLLALRTAQPAPSHEFPIHALQVPEYSGSLHLLDGPAVETARRLNLEVHAWTINDEEAMRRMLELGVDGIITDYPDRLMRLLDAAGRSRR